jgi:subtilisin family serine protease
MDIPEAPGLPTRDILVACRGDLSWVAALGLEVKSRPAYAPGWVVLRAPDAEAAFSALPALRARAGVRRAEVLRARRRYPRGLPDDPLISSQWQFNPPPSAPDGTFVNIRDVWNYPGEEGLRGAGVRIGIVDDGIEGAHEDLSPNYDAANGWDWNDDDDDPSPAPDDIHGTACAGLAAARGDNGTGICGAAPEATLVGLRLIAAPVTDEQEAGAMAWKNDIIQIKSNSWGPSDSGHLLEAPGPLARAALENAASEGRGGLGTIFVWAAGNGGDSGDNSNYDGYANSIYTIAVGAVDRTGNPSSYSEPGTNVMVAAPAGDSDLSLGATTTDLSGEDGYNPAPSSEGGDYTSDFEGTSSAAPVVAGIVALMLEKNPRLGWRDVQEILMRSARRIHTDDPEWTQNAAGFFFHPRMGAGVVDAAAAVALAGGWETLAPASVLTRKSINLGLHIPENDAAGVTREIDISTDGFRCEHVTVTVNIIHSARGNLRIELVSPSGTRSRLADVHVDLHDHYTNWTFSTVRNWGEDAGGVWKINVADISGTGNSIGGTLNSVELAIHGVPSVPQNPPPEVVVLEPENNTVFSPGETVVVEAEIFDLDASGAPGTIASATLLDNGNPVGTLTAPPFRFSYSPTPGEHRLAVRATDDEGALPQRVGRRWPGPPNGVRRGLVNG